MFFYAGYAIHGTYWHNNFGQNVSHGCVNVNLTDAAWLYAWTPLGTKVVIHSGFDPVSGPVPGCVREPG